MTQRLVVIGAGMAAGRLLDHLMSDAPDAYEVTLFNAEPRGTYNRLMLSPVLAGEKTYADIVTHDEAWYKKHGVTCRFGEQVTSIDTEAKIITGSNGTVAYDKLVFATGSNPFIIPFPGHKLPGVIAYRDLEDTELMMGLGARTGSKAVVIGGGVLGLEAAAGMAAQGVEVTVVHDAGHLMNRQLDPAGGALLEGDLAAKGINVICSAKSRDILEGENGRVRALRLDDGTDAGLELPCDLLVMAVGIRPSTALAKNAGVLVERGVVIDDQLRTDTPDVFALGECTEHNGTLFGLVAPLYDQAEVLAKTLMGIEATFVQKELSTKLKVTGCDLFSAGDFENGEGREAIVFSDPKERNYKRLVIENGRMIGAVMYGDTADGGVFYSLIKAGTDIEPMRDQLIFGPAFEAPETPLSTCAIAEASAPTAIVRVPETSS
jgi:nitrite reductase (NADH) large subunit